MGTETHWELSKRFNFERSSKRYVHKLESIVGNETYKVLWNFEIQKDPLILARRRNLVLIFWKMVRTCQVDFAGPADYQGKRKESEKNKKQKQILGPCQRTNKAVKQVGNSDNNSCYLLGTILKGLENKKVGKIGIQGKNRDKPD